MWYKQHLESVLHEIVTRWDVAGLSIGIVQNDEIVYTKDFGVQSVETRAPITTASRFCVASVSKVFVATAVMQLVERGQIDLDAPLVRYLPWLRLADERYRQITTRQMLSHTSGMPDMDELDYIELWRQAQVDDGAHGGKLDRQRYVRRLQETKLIAAPGERFQYSNIGYNVLGAAIEELTGTSFETHIKEHVLAPSGMPDSTFLPAEVPGDLLAVPHLYVPELAVNPVYPYHRADAPCGALHTTTVDMCHWLMMCLNRGRWNGHTVLQPGGFEQMWSPVVERSWPPLYRHMGLGWNLGHVEGTRTVSHGGVGGGLTAIMILLPEKKRAAVGMCNSESLAHYQVLSAVTEALVDGAPQVGKVAWGVPIRQALAEGGIQAAYECYETIKANNTNDYAFDEDSLLITALQMIMAQKSDLAIEVLKLNVHAFPKHAYSHVFLAQVYLRQGETELARESATKALAIEPGHAAAMACIAAADCADADRADADCADAAKLLCQEDDE